LARDLAVDNGGRMIVRTAGSIATLLIALGGLSAQALAQYYPPGQAYPPQGSPPAQTYSRQPLPPTVDAHDLPPLNVPVQESPPPVNAGYGQGTGAYPANGASAPAAGGQGSQPVQPQYYGNAGARPYYSTPGAIAPGPPGSAQQDAIREEAMRSRLRGPAQIVGSGSVDPRVLESSQGAGPSTSMAAFPPEVRPETDPKKELPPQFRRTLSGGITTQYR